MSISQDPEESQLVALSPFRQVFVNALYQQHLEEASFLYEQRFSLLDNPEIN